ncbi:embryogenesis-like protein [Bidens hawaiensis]|uniref:embryogenesis-like protein n=1 Tax=Bidens hawaiensis TaxID=980011 RepID=UPI00404A537A
MHPRTHLSICKFLTRYPFISSPNPKTLIPSKPISTNSFHPFFINPTTLNNNNKPSYTQFKICRAYNVETDKVVDEINLKFAEAREEIEMAMESKETVYFNEEAECARAVVKQVLDLYDGLLSKLPEKERGGIQRSMGLKIEQLKAELEQLNE